MAFGQFLIVKPQSGNSDPVAILKDIRSFICGETDLANMPKFVNDVQTYIVNTVPAGWEFIREYEDADLPGAYLWAFTMRAPLDNSPGKYKYVTLSVTATGDLWHSFGDKDVLPGGHIPQITHGYQYTSLTNSYHRLQLAQSYFLNITVSPRHFLLFPQVSGPNNGATGMIERTRFNVSWDTASSDWLPVVYFIRNISTTDSRAGFQRVMEPVPSPRNISPVAYIGVRLWAPSMGHFNAVYDVAGVPKYFLYQPKYAWEDVELGIMHPSVPLYAIGTVGAGDRSIPSKTCGATVTIGSDDYMVWSATYYASVANTPLYIRKE